MGPLASLRRPIRLLTAAALLLAVGCLAGFGLAQSAKPPVEREALAASDAPRGAKGRTLGLARVVVRPGARLPLHYHEGTQIARIAKGTLTYSVRTGRVPVRRGDADKRTRPVRVIKAGETARLRTGQWIVEQPNVHHHAANKGADRVVIYVSTLLRKGAPPSTPVDD